MLENIKAQPRNASRATPNLVTLERLRAGMPTINRHAKKAPLLTMNQWPGARLLAEVFEMT
jgi:hypothetical protein